MIKGSIQQKDITIINIHAYNTGALIHVKQILTELKGEIEYNEVTSTVHQLQRTDQPDRK